MRPNGGAPTERLSEPSRWAKALAIVAVAVPALGLGVAVLLQAVAEGASLSLNQVFHLVLGLALLGLFAQFTSVIRRSRSGGAALALGGTGLLAAVLGAVVAELFGPPALAGLVILCAVWKLATVCRKSASAQVVEQAPQPDNAPRV